jgi:hypothetical protein
MALAILLCAIYLPDVRPSQAKLLTVENETTSKSRLGRVDFNGAILFAIAILAVLTPLEVGGTQISWTHPLIWISVAVGAVVFYLFLRVEKRAAEPIIPLDVFRRRDAVLSFVIMGLQVAAQLGVKIAWQPSHTSVFNANVHSSCFPFLYISK